MSAQEVVEGAVDPAVRAVAEDRVRNVLAVLAGRQPTAELPALLDALAVELRGHDVQHYWLVHAAVLGRLPTEPEVEALVRASRLDGPRAVLERVVRTLQERPGIATAPTVEIVTDQVTVDVQHTSSVDFTSGIQRVVRECVHRWCLREDVRLLSWHDDCASFRPLRDGEWSNVTLGQPRPGTEPDVIVVPWRNTHLIPELAVDPGRGLKIAAMARYSAVSIGIIGYDVIPLTTPSSVTDGMVGHFTRFLAGSAHVSRIAAISGAAAEELAGWRDMLAGRGIQGPQVSPVVLPVTARESAAAEHDEVRRLMRVAGLPLFLVVGSHEPRKNHLAVLHAAELLWREGHRFSLVFVGAGSWKAEAFYAQVEELQAAGRPVQSIRGLPDNLLWAAYRESHAVLFPSLNEGYGLPVAEALATGTPVITSNFGSTAEIVSQSGRPRGGLLVDARDDHAIAEAMRLLLCDPGLRARLAGEALEFDQGTWDDYAEQVWQTLVVDDRA